MSKRFYYTIIVLMVVAGNCVSQVAKEDFAKINKVYSDNHQLSMKMKYEVYKNKNSATALQTETGEVVQAESGKYTRIGKIETIETDQYRLIVDHEEKNMSMLGISNEEQPVAKPDASYMVNLEQLLGICSKVEFKKINDSQNNYTMVIPDEEYEEISISFNSTTFFIEKMTLYYKEKQNLEEKENGLKEAPRMEISYYDVNTKPNLKNAVFTYSRFLEKRNGKWIGKAPYQDYKINELSFN
jgi:hypothetical protein